MWLNLMTAPAEQPITLVEAKLHLRVETTDEDDLITALIIAATQHLEGRTGLLGRALVTQTWEWRFDRFPPGNVPILVPLPPLQTVTEIKYTDPDGAVQILAASVYQVHPETYQGEIRRKPDQTWPAIRAEPYGITVTFVAGYGTAADVPEAIKAAIKLLIGGWFLTREESEIPPVTKSAVAALTGPFKVHWV